MKFLSVTIQIEATEQYFPEFTKHKQFFPVCVWLL